MTSKVNASTYDAEQVEKVCAVEWLPIENSIISLISNVVESRTKAKAALSVIVEVGLNGYSAPVNEN